MIDVAVIGAGAWGTALAMRAARNGKATYLWARNPVLRAALTGARMHRDALPGVAFPPALGIGRSLAECAKARCLFMVVPAQATRAALREVAPMLGESPLITLCAKGLERETLAFQSQIAAQEAPGAQLVVLSGPSFAGDVARDRPTAVTLAGEDSPVAHVAGLLQESRFRVYASRDVIGAQLGGALKNVMAIACGAAMGLTLGESARAALMTRGFAEMRRMGHALGARLETLCGLSGLGDLALSCASPRSRNFALGAALASGEEAVIASARARLAEGALTARAAGELAVRLKVGAPICAAVDALVSGAITAEDAMARLLGRPPRREDE